MSYPNPFDEENLEPTEAQTCPVGPISIERFDLGMDEIKRMYALVMAENKELRRQIGELEGDKE